MDLTQTSLNVDDLDKLLKICRQNGVLHLKVDNLEFRLAESLPIVNNRVIMEEPVEVQEDVEGLDKSKLADLKRLRAQQNVLKQLFNDV